MTDLERSILILRGFPRDDQWAFRHFDCDMRLLDMRY